MSKQTFRAIFTSKQVQRILSEAVIAQRGLMVDNRSVAISELMAVASRDENGNPEINQYRLEFTVEVTGDSWKW